MYHMTSFQVHNATQFIFFDAFPVRLIQILNTVKSKLTEKWLGIYISSLIYSCQYLGAKMKCEIGLVKKG